MKLEIAYEFPWTPWSVARVYDIVAKKLQKANPSSVRVNSHLYREANPCNFNSCQFLTITNPDTGNYLAVSYWDRCHELFISECGWDINKLKGIYTSAGVFHLTEDLSKEHNIPIIPISYCTYHNFVDELAKNSTPANKKPNKNLLFRGFLYNERKELSKLLPENFISTQDTGERLIPLEYYKELANHSINLSLNGSAEICHRDIEILSTRSVLIRPTLNQKFKNDLIEGVHYLGFDSNNPPELLAKDIMNIYSKLSKEPKLVEKISENGYKWYLENGSIEKNAEIILKQLDLNLLK